MFKFQIKDGEAGEPRTSKISLERVNLEGPVNIHNHSEIKNHQKGLKLLRSPKQDLRIQECILDLGMQEQVDTEFGSRNNYILKGRINALTKPRSRNILQVRFNPNKVMLSPKQLLDLVKCQKANYNLSAITIPDPIRDFNDAWKKAFSRAIVYSQEAIETQHKSLYMPIIHLEQPRNMVQAKVEWLLEHDIQALGFRGTGTDITKKLDIAKKLVAESEKSIWLHVFDISKKILLEVSHAHLIPLLGVDTVSIRKGFSFSTETKIKDETGGDFATPVGVVLKPEPITRPFNQRHNKDLFEGQALGYMNTEELSHAYGNTLNCSCPLCRKNRSIENLNQFLSSPHRRALVQVHETFGFLSEFRNIQQSIKDNKVNDYYIGKSMIERNLYILKENFPYLEEESK